MIELIYVDTPKGVKIIPVNTRRCYMEDFPIYFSDLTESAQRELLEAVGINDPKEMNWDMDILPIAYYPIGNQDFD